MFTGIIQAVGRIAYVAARGGDVRLSIDAGALEMEDVALGDSIACNGVCLTVAELRSGGFAADVSRETLALSTLRRLRPGSRINLEKALTLATRLGGHLVSGHVDGVGHIVERHADARSVRMSVEAPAVLAKYIAHKGSICVDGVSLTVNGVLGARFELNIVPHTLGETTLDDCREGSEVNLEVDLIARYLERLMQGEGAAEPTPAGVTEALLKSRGFMR